MTEPQSLPEINGLPELLRFRDGREVRTEADWRARREEILSLYSYYIYGEMPDRRAERVTYAIEGEPVTGGKLLTVTVEAGDRRASFPVLVTLPSEEPPDGGFPYVIEYMPWHYRKMFKWNTAVSPNCAMAARRGYAGINYDPLSVAADNSGHTGAFYTLYPYNETEPDTCRGTLLAWAWGVSRIIDAMENGAGKELRVDPSLSVVMGVSRFGKSTAAAGAYDERVRVVVPACSGVGGTAVFRMSNHGKAYDLSSIGGMKKWVNRSVNEPFSNLTGGEAYWFCGRFRQFASAKALPVDQHMLCALTAGRNRHMIMVTGITSEGWSNTEGQCLAYAASRPAWELVGHGDGNNLLIHLDGHAIPPEDMRIILDYCDSRLLGKENAANGEWSRLKGQLFLEENRDRLDALFLPFL